jgi:opacity protein-like surface antigen
MKKILAAVCLVLLISWPAFGSGFKLQFGPAFTSLNYSDMSILPSWINKNSLLQFTGGVGFELSFSSNFALELDIMYAPGGVEFKGTTGGITVTETFKGYAVSMPVLFKVSFLPGTTPYIVTGGYLAYTTSQKAILDVSPGIFHSEDDMTDDVNRFQYGLVFGGGVEIVIASMNFLVEGRYALALSNLNKHDFLVVGDTAKSTIISILIGYKF